MLGKLLKFEMKATARILLPLYPLVIILALVNKLLFSLLKQDNIVTTIISSISITAYIISTLVIFALTFIIMIQRFYKNLLKEEGYLSFTLPVTTTQHILSKLLVSSFWNVCAGIVTLISILIIIPSYGFVSEITTSFSDISAVVKENVGVGLGILIAGTILLLFISIFTSTLTVYASMAIGHLADKARVLFSFLAYFGIYIVNQTISSIIFAVIGLGNNEFFSVNDTVPKNFMYIVFFTSIILSVIIGVACFITTKLILDKKLNLE